MRKNVLEYLEDSVNRFPDRTAYFDETSSYTFKEVDCMAKAIGSRIASLGMSGKPVAVMMEKSAAMAAALLGVVSGGSPYCPIDVAMPPERMEIIFSVLKPAAVIAGAQWKGLAEEVLSRFAEDFSGELEMENGETAPDNGAIPIFLFEELIDGPVETALLKSVREEARETDPLYILFTSGSTGIPKGVIGNHKIVINNMEWLASRYDFGAEDVLGNQVPLHFVVANHDLYCPLRFGCSAFFIPAQYFSFPAKLIPLLNEKRVTTVFWVPFALGMAANLRTLEETAPEFLRYVFFVGEVMPMKQLNYWRNHVPGARYVNLYGSTETHMCCFYEVEGEYSEEETLPIGGPCANIDVLVLDENDKPILPGGGDSMGELCIRGAAVGAGYYNNPEKTRKRYILNPGNPDGGEIIYRTGDLVRYREEGLLQYCGRMDYQIKHLGYRIELGEIEAAAGKVPQVKNCACLYHGKKQLILFLYDGEQVERKVLSAFLLERLPKYMMPNRYIYLDEMPRNANGKIDRKLLMEQYGQ